jgi:hypothetical protein
MLTKITTICAAVALGAILAVPTASFAQDKDKSDTSTTAKPHHKAKKGHSDTVHENARYDRRKKGHADTVHEQSGHRP